MVPSAGAHARLPEVLKLRSKLVGFGTVLSKLIASNGSHVALSQHYSGTVRERTRKTDIQTADCNTSNLSIPGAK